MLLQSSSAPPCSWDSDSIAGWKDMRSEEAQTGHFLSFNFLCALLSWDSFYLASQDPYLHLRLGNFSYTSHTPQESWRKEFSTWSLDMSNCDFPSSAPRLGKPHPGLLIKALGPAG